MMRIIAGQFKGRKLLTPEDTSIRPTSDRTRESIFNLLMHGQYAGENIVGQPVLDLCCGTGALGLEALSRGARIATFVDKNKTALALARQNALHCGVTQQCFFIQGDAASLPPAREAVALVLIDAPYATPLLAPAYEALRRGGWLAPHALIVAEQERGANVPTLNGAELIDERQYGKPKVLVYRVAP
ncbi:MAG: 16S rRNA (guanine(966)-N(2))-methyltransferase RsmD [Alphaproteobacteria bacterium]|nr:16S rRNA (guanine(966)-N(2))-methyltransferase RsmD [Alphaproteobacteria bacterium]